MAAIRALTRDVEWTASFVATLVYAFVTISYKIGGAPVALVVALVTIPLQKRQMRLPPFLVVLALMVVWAFLSWSQGEWKDASWNAAYALAKIWLMAFAVVNAVRSRAQVRFFLFFVLGIIALFPVRGALFNYFLYGATERGRVGWINIFENPNDLAGMLLVPLSLCLGFWATERKKSLIWWCALAGVMLIAIVIVLSQSRGGTLAMLLLLGLSLAGQRRRLRVFIVAGAAVGLALLLAPRTAFDRLSTLLKTTNAAALGGVADEGSAEQRYEIWKVARRIFSENPALGVGPGAYRSAHLRTSMRAEFKPTARGNRDAHSTYLTVLAELGIGGFLLFATAIVMVLVSAEQVRRQAVSALPSDAQHLFFLELGFVAFLVAGIFGTYGSAALFYLYLSMVLLVAEVLRERLGPSDVRVRHRQPHTLAVAR